MKPEAYPAARTISPKLHAYFSCYRDAALASGETDLAPLPDAETIEAIIDAAFWASLRREEGVTPRISLAFLSPEDSDHPLLLDRPLPVNPGALTRVAPAVERPGIHLGVWRDQGELVVWGATRGIPVLCFVLEVAAPGMLVVKHHSGQETRKFINVAVLEGDQIKLVLERPSDGAHFPQFLKSLLHSEPNSSLRKSSITAVQLAVSMREHGHGGLLLLVPEGSEEWRASVMQPLLYGVSPPFRELADPAAHAPDATAAAIAVIGGLTAVDGAVVLNTRYELLGFGAKIGRKQGSPRVEQVVLSEPIQFARPVLVHPDELGGTRHLSAAQFVHDQRDAVALVASQDGRFTILEWSDADSQVHAHRLESLLM